MVGTRKVGGGGGAKGHSPKERFGCKQTIQCEVQALYGRLATAVIPGQGCGMSAPPLSRGT